MRSDKLFKKTIIEMKKWLDAYGQFIGHIKEIDETMLDCFGYVLFD